MDYKYSLDLLKRLNRFVERNGELKGKFLYQGYNLWQAYQQSIFGDILSWSENRDVKRVTSQTHLFSHLKTIILALFTIGFSFISILYLIVSRKETMVFSMDKITGYRKNDFRLNALYEALEATSSSYMETIHAVLGKGMIKNLLDRSRPVIYLETADFLASASVAQEKTKLKRNFESLDLSYFREDERHLIKTLLLKYGSSIVISRYRTVLFRTIFSLSALEKIFSIDDVRTINEVVIAAELSGVDFYSIQHGHFTKYHVGWLKMTKLPGKNISPKSIIVWSEYWKKELIRLGTYFSPKQIIVGGQNRKIFNVAESKQSQKIAVMFPYEKNAPKEEVLRYVKKLLEQNNVEVVFKLRQDQEKQEQIEEYELLPLVKKIRFTSNTEEALASVDIVVGTYSTLLYEAVEQKRPVAILKTSIDYGDGMISNGLAGRLSLDGDIYTDLEKITDTSDQVLDERRNKLVGIHPLVLRDNLVKLLRCKSSK